ncbi:Dot/Icm T4SS effector MceF [Coxiella burnetii]|uniref:Dot/Icm T4SS effector MceF n=1 Tax=Coxiella burnetii TaxID=777 RepID=UPI000BFEA97C|nr:Dot/Icm T4SS effector MceF [Coxiella burnetii]PHH56592.1 hypothetical protein CRH12_10095 [Coxiella burnetii]
MQPTAETPLLAEEKYKDEEAKPTKAMLGEKDELSRLPDDVLESLSPFLLVKEARKLSIVDHNLYDRITNLTLFSSSFAHEEKKIKLQLAEQSLKRIEQNRREMYSRRRMYISFFPLSMACLPCLIHDRFFIFGPLNEFQRFQQRYPQDYQNIKSILPDNSENSLTFMQVRRSLQILKEEIRQSESNPLENDVKTFGK